MRKVSLCRLQHCAPDDWEKGRKATRNPVLSASSSPILFPLVFHFSQSADRLPLLLCAQGHYPAPPVDITSVQDTHTLRTTHTQQDLMAEAVDKPGSGQHPPLIFWEQCRAHTPICEPAYLYSSPNSCPPTKAEALWITDFLLILFMRKHHNPCSWISSSTIPTQCLAPVSWLVIHYSLRRLWFVLSCLFS